VEAEPLKALGVLVNENTVKSYAYANGIAKQGAALTEVQKVQARYGVIMKSTKNAQGDLARTMDSPTNKLRIMKEQATQIGIQFGEVLIPVLEKLMNIIKPLMDKFQGLSKGQQEMIVKIAMVAAAIGPVILIVGQIISIAGAVSSAISAISGAIAAAGGASAVFGTVIAALTGPVGIAIGIIAALVGVFVLLYKNNEEFRNNVATIWNQIKQLFQIALNNIKLLIQVFVTTGKKFWSEYGESIVRIFSIAFDLLASIVNTGLGVIKNIINIVIKLIKGDWKGVWEGIKTLTFDLLNGTVKIVKNAMNLIINYFRYIFNLIKDIAAIGWKAVLNVTIFVFNKVKSAVMKPINAVVQFVREQINKIKNLFAGMQIKIPKIKLPHFKISGSFSIAPPSVPKFSVNWYATGGIFNRPSIIGVGESGTEAVIPIDKLEDLIVKALKKSNGANLTLNIENFINNTQKDIEKLAYELEFYRRRVSYGRGGV
jgi:hypothetical protein